MTFYNFLFKKFIFPVAEFVNGSSIQKYYLFLMQSQNWSKEKLMAYQNKRLNCLLNHAYNNVSYYRILFDKLNIKPDDIKTVNDLKKIPFLTKNIIKSNDLEAKNYLKNRFSKFTSGSTGTPTKFYHTKDDFSWFWGATFRNWSWFGYVPGDKYIKISLNKRGLNIKKRIQDFLSRCIYIYSYEMDESSVKNYVEKILKSKVKFIYGYSSSLSVIADYMLKNNIYYSVDSIVTTGDNLYPKAKINIEKAFGTKIYDDYGCGGEGLNIAAMCEAGSYHINDELMIVETEKFDDHDEIIVTSLNNYAMPLIRYRVGDFVKISNNSCTCGKKLDLIDSINGRADDIVIAPNGSKLVVHFFNTIMEYVDGVDAYKVVQNSKNKIIIEIIKNLKYNQKKDELKISEYIQQATHNTLFVIFKYVQKIPKRKSGKYKFIEVNL